MSLKLPKNTSLQDLYLEEDQTIWFLIWILKKSSPCDQYISQMILESSFQVIQDIDYIGYPRKYIRKNGIRHGLNRMWYHHGLDRMWYHNGQLRIEIHWKNGRTHGSYREWYGSGQLRFEYHCVNGILHGPEHEWYRNGQLNYEENWENGVRI